MRRDEHSCLELLLWGIEKERPLVEKVLQQLAVVRRAADHVAHAVVHIRLRGVWTEPEADHKVLDPALALLDGTRVV
jgi:DNA-binding FrmR family transcriptional regulator